MGIDIHLKASGDAAGKAVPYQRVCELHRRLRGYCEAVEGVTEVLLPSWVAGVNWVTDDVQAVVEVVSSREGCGIFDPIVEVVEGYASTFFETRVGCAPLASKAISAGFASKIAMLREDLKAAMTNLSNSYCFTDFAAPDAYRDEPFRVGYLLKFTHYNACLAAGLLHWHSDLLNLRPPVRAVCYGGGPGTDWLALRAVSRGAALECGVYDLPCWSPLWKPGGIGDYARGEDKVWFAAADITQPFTGFPGAPHGWAPSIATFFYTLNEVAQAASKGHLLDFLRGLCGAMEPGGVVIILDRTRNTALQLLDEVASELHDLLDVQLFSKRFELVLPMNEVNRAANFASKFGVRPRLAGKVGVTVFRVRPSRVNGL